MEKSMERFDATGAVRATVIPQYSQPRILKSWRVKLEVFFLGEWSIVETPELAVRYSTLELALTAAQWLADSHSRMEAVH